MNHNLEMYQQNIEQFLVFKKKLNRFMMYYKFGMDELETKINILNQEFQYVHDYNPIEHVSSRLKTPESVLKKIRRKGYSIDLEVIRENIKDIAGIRINCSFVSDIYRIAAMLAQQSDMEVIEYKDYIENPKPNGYQSLHLLIQIPVFMSDRTEKVYVEVQLRTIAMDFWASLEHKIYYKHHEGLIVPQKLQDDLKEAAMAITLLDQKMEEIHKEMEQLKIENYQSEFVQKRENNEF